jgi:hypothetical protein
MKPIILALLAVFLAPLLARADTITTTATVSVQVGCWNPSICSDPAAYWGALGLPVPVVEPPAEDFAPYGGPLFLFTYDASDGMMIASPIDPVATPEPGTFLLMGTGVLLFSIVSKRLEGR